MTKETANKNMFGFLTEESLKLFGDELTSVIVFGSYGRKSYINSSDLDVIIITEENNEVNTAEFRKSFLLKFEKRLDLQIFTKKELTKNFEDFSPLFTTLLLGKIILFDKNYFFRRHFANFVQRVLHEKIFYCEGNKIWEMKKAAENLENLH